MNVREADKVFLKIHVCVKFQLSFLNNSETDYWD